jgi:hypothetical protein
MVRPRRRKVRGSLSVQQSEVAQLIARKRLQAACFNSMHHRFKPVPVLPTKFNPAI